MFTLSAFGPVLSHYTSPWCATAFLYLNSMFVLFINRHKKIDHWDGKQGLANIHVGHNKDIILTPTWSTIENHGETVVQDVSKGVLNTVCIWPSMTFF